MPNDVPVKTGHTAFRGRHGALIIVSLSCQSQAQSLPELHWAHAFKRALAPCRVVPDDTVIDALLSNSSKVVPSHLHLQNISVLNTSKKALILLVVAKAALRWHRCGDTRLGKDLYPLWPAAVAPFVAAGSRDAFRLPLPIAVIAAHSTKFAICGWQALRQFKDKA